MYDILGADQKQYGPVSAEVVRQWITERRANSQTMIQPQTWFQFWHRQV